MLAAKDLRQGRTLTGDTNSPFSTSIIVRADISQSVPRAKQSIAPAIALSLSRRLSLRLPVAVIEWPGHWPRQVKATAWNILEVEFSWYSCSG